MAEFQTVFISAIPDAGDFIKRLSVQPSGMSAFNFLGQSLTTLIGYRKLKL